MLALPETEAGWRWLSPAHPAGFLTRVQRASSRRPEGTVPLVHDEVKRQPTQYAAAIAGVFAARNPIAQLGFDVAAGCAVAFRFVLGHDAAHGALFASDRWSEALGTMAMLPSLNMYRMWSYGHNKVHHGVTSFSPIDWIWRPLTPDEYRSRTRAKRLVYQLERNPATWACTTHYVLRV